MRYLTRMDMMVGDPGLFGSIGRFLGKAAGVATSFVPGGALVRGGIQLATGLLSRPQAQPGGGVSVAQVPRMSAMGLQPGQFKKKGKVKVGVSPLGTVGMKETKSRRMNVANAKAGRRAIRRIKGLRHLLQSIERELPRRRAVSRGGSMGVITRAEARRALSA